MSQSEDLYNGVNMNSKRSTEDMDVFQEMVLQYYADHRRSMPWRDDHSGYSVLVSEVMLQQTQVNRVFIKYAEFMSAFPSVDSLAQASVEDVLRVWKGLGYNRRALWLQKAAQSVRDDYDGVVPSVRDQLVALPGIGPNTAGAILAYVYNQPEVFIETNIRRVFLHHFFRDQQEVTDNQLLPYIAQALEGQEPRTWYWALMDYGTYLGQTLENPNRRSKHYSRQSAFEGSHRQVRGQLLERALQSAFTVADMMAEYPKLSGETLDRAIEELIAEGFLSRTGETLTMKTND